MKVSDFSSPHRQTAGGKERRARFVLMGGFLGAGKTTCMVALAKWLGEGGLRCGLITNDQGQGLVDTATARADGGTAAVREPERSGDTRRLPSLTVREPKRSGDTRRSSPFYDVREITGGCFCCRSDELVSALRELEKSAHPDVFIAEPVGSCTDLVATVLLPLEQVYRAGLKSAPMSVVLDAKRAWSQYFSRVRGGGFSKDVRYIYLKQMEEAEILVVNKSDLLTAAQLERLRKRLESDFAGKRVLPVCARSGEGMEAWFEFLLEGESAPDRIMEVDYKRYGEGEALLGWFNARLKLKPWIWKVDANVLLVELAGNIQRKLEAESVEIAHFKMSLHSPDGAEMAVVNAVRNGSPAEISRPMKSSVEEGTILINLRAEGAPALLKRIVKKEISGLPVTWEETAAFRPGKPKPVHRATALKAV